MAFQALAFQLDAFQQEAVGPTEPELLGPIPPITRTFGTGSHTYELGAYFSGADSYAIAPAVEAGWSFNTSTAQLVIDTDAIGNFGPFTITATNAQGDTDSNAFWVQVIAAEETGGSGGWGFLNQYDAEQHRRRRRAKARKKLEEETEEIQDGLDKQIAQLLRKQEAEDDKREDHKRLKGIAKANADYQAAKEYSERVEIALRRVVQQGNYSAIEALERELKRAEEEAEFLAIVILTAFD